jgi:acetyl-CoA carboxylase biotin carboxyl carrier protein
MSAIHRSAFIIHHFSEGGCPVAEEASDTPSPFDVQTIKYLVTLMSRHDLSEIDLRDGPARLRLRRGPRRVSPPPPTPAPAAPNPPPAAAAAAPPGTREESTRPARALVEIKSPTPGTFYAKANPDAETYVRVGSRVTPTTVVGLIEAMKLYNEITADCTGVIAEILVENAQAVEYGEVLFRVDPTA